jgi:hypothetical protein
VIIAESLALLERCFPGNAVDTVPSSKGACSQLSVYSSHLRCVFPQHGPGPKHERAIGLEDWQWRSLEAAPWAFLRGCIRSDGSVFVNRTGPYEYLSCDFGNCSADIVGLFASACDLAGIAYRVNCHRGAWHVRINRRASMARVLEHVGLKR